MISWTRDGSEPCHAPVRSQRSHVRHSDSLFAQETGKGKAINIFSTVDIFLCKRFIFDSSKTQTSLAKPLVSPPRAASRRRNQFRRMDRGNSSSPPSLTWSSTGDVLGSWPQLSFSLCWERGEGERGASPQHWPIVSSTAVTFQNWVHKIQMQRLQLFMDTQKYITAIYFSGRT